MGKIKYIAIKEIRHILRDSRSLTIAILMPLMMTLLYGYAINLDIKNIKLAVMDLDKTQESRELIRKFYNSGYFARPSVTTDISDPERTLKSGNASAVLTIKPGFASALTNLRQYELGFLVDGADANLAAASFSYSGIILKQFFEEKLPPQIELPGVVISQQILYNPDMKSSHFFVPGLIASILMMISAMLTSLTVAREKETGTMEQLLTSPVTPVQVIVGKILPYIGLALLDGILVIIFAMFHFGVPFVGSKLLLFFFSIIYIVAALSLGILISTLVSTQQVAMMAAQSATMLPSTMLSGFIFEIKNMPKVLQYITYIVPAKYFLLIIRGIMLKGSSINVLWTQAIFLVVLTLILLSIAVKKFELKIG